MMDQGKSVSLDIIFVETHLKNGGPILLNILELELSPFVLIVKNNNK